MKTWLAALTLVLAVWPAGAAVFEVTKTADTLDLACDDDCSLREAVAAANARKGADVVILGAGTYLLTRAGNGENSNATGDLDVSGDLILLGVGADRTVIDGGGLDRVLDTLNLPLLEIHDLTLRNGWARPSGLDSGDGGGIQGYKVILERCVVTGNRALNGGGILSSVVTMKDSTVSANDAALAGGGITALLLDTEGVTISGNHAGEEGGGIWVNGLGELTETTISGNRADIRGGGVHTGSPDCPSDGSFCHGFVGLTRSVLAGNTAAHQPDCSEFLVPEDGGYNVFGSRTDCQAGPTDRAGTSAEPLDPKLSPLGGQGGPTPTHLPLPGSPAIDLGPSCGGTDQRGAPRPFDGDGDGNALCDAGAVEVSSACLTTDADLCLQGTRFRASVTWQTATDQGIGHTVPLTTDTGSFWFFGPDNLELTVKVLDGCGVNQHFWVFLAGLTDVEVEVTVVDTKTGESRKYNHPGKVPFQPRLDTAAFAACP